MNTKVKWALGIFAAITTLALPVIKAHLPKEKLVYQKNNVALEGYDLVSYFVQDEPQKGNADFVVKHEGVDYYFGSEAHKELFLENPQAYLPQYGAWCATAIASGTLVDPSPTSYTVEDGKLYLFFSYMGLSPKNKWTKQNSELKAKADQHWSKIKADQASSI